MLAKGDWIELPLAVVGHALKALRAGTYSALEVTLLMTGLAVVVWFAQIRSRIFVGDDQKTERLARYPFGLCVLGLSVWLLLLTFYLGGVG